MVIVTYSCYWYLSFGSVDFSFCQRYSPYYLFNLLSAEVKKYNRYFSADIILRIAVFPSLFWLA